MLVVVQTPQFKAVVVVLNIFAGEPGASVDQYNYIM